MRRLRESYAAKLFAGLLGTVGVLLVLAYVVVRAETASQVQESAARAVQSATRQLTAVEELRRRETDRAAQRLTRGRRTEAVLDYAIETGQWSDLIGEAEYELALANLPVSDMVLAYTDPRGRLVVTFHGEAMAGEDPARLQRMAERVLDGEAFELPSYRVLEGRLFSIRTRLLEIGGRAIGTLSLGIPILDEELAGVGEVAGVEVCLVVDGDCVAATPAARGELAERLASLAGAPGARRVQAMGEPWSVQSQPLVEGDPAQGHRVIAVPLAPVLAPFERITRALLLGGGLALVLAVIVGVMLSRGLTRPVRALVAATGRVAEGDYEAEVPVTTHDELGTLAEAFNDMTRGLLLKERLRSILDVVSSREVAEELVQGGLELGGENREVTVLFADIRGFSALTEGMEPQKVITFLNECMQLLSDAVVEQGGHVDKYVGDELMAVFNAPKEVTDHTGRALKAGLAMQRAMERWNLEREARGERPIGLGVGVNTGVVVAGKMGSQTRNNYTVLGDSVNLASRLCSAAKAGEVLATRRCLALAEAPFQARRLGSRAFKGFTGEIEVLSVEALGGIGGSGNDEHGAGLPSS